MNAEVQKQIKTRKIWFRIMLVLGLVGLVSTGTKGAIPFGILTVYGVNNDSPNIIFSIVGTIMVLFNLLFIPFLIAAFLISKDIKKLQDGSQEKSSKE